MSDYSDIDNLESKLDEPVKAEVVFKFVSVPLADTVCVRSTPIWTDGPGSADYFDDYGPRKKELVTREDLDSCFFAMNFALMNKGAQPTHKLPKGFYCNEFLALNPLDIQELLMFQRKYGRITGLRKRKPYGTDTTELMRPEPDGDIFAGIRASYYSDQLAGIEASRSIYDTVPDQEYLEERLLNRLSAVSFREAIASVLDAQTVIKDLLRVLRPDLGVMTKREAAAAKEASEYASLILSKAVPPLELAIEGVDGPNFHSLIDGIFIQLARALLNNDAYRVCANPECGRLFTPREMERRLDTKYCCPQCQERAKRLRYVGKHSKKC